MFWTGRLEMKAARNGRQFVVVLVVDCRCLDSLWCWQTDLLDVIKI